MALPGCFDDAGAGSSGDDTTAGETSGETTGPATGTTGGGDDGATTGDGGGSSTGDGGGTTSGGTGDTTGETTGTVTGGSTGGTGGSTGGTASVTESTGSFVPPECSNGIAEAGEFCLGPYTEAETVNPALDVVTADFDNNDNLDLFTAQGWDAEFETLLGNGAGLFASGPYDVSGPPYAYFVAAGRLNNDDIPDMIWAEDDTNGVAVRLNDGFGTLQEGVNDGTYPFATINALAVGDVDDNSYDDIIVTTDSGTYLLQAGNAGDGTLSQSTIYSFGTHTDAAVAELNGNAAVDVAIVYGSSLRLEFGTNNGQFPTDDTVSIGDTAERIAIGDIDSDGDADIAVTIPSLNAVRVMEGAGNGGFSALVDLAAGNGVADVVVVDLTGDGYEDVVASNLNDDTLSVFLANPAGGFEAPQMLTLTGAPAREPRNMTVGDFNEDGAPDIAVTLDVDSIGLFISDA